MRKAPVIHAKSEKLRQAEAAIAEKKLHQELLDTHDQTNLDTQKTKKNVIATSPS